MDKQVQQDFQGTYNYVSIILNHLWSEEKDQKCLSNDWFLPLNLDKLQSVCFGIHIWIADSRKKAS
jgi:hypothetical protein